MEITSIESIAATSSATGGTNPSLLQESLVKLEALALSAMEAEQASTPGSTEAVEFGKLATDASKAATILQDAIAAGRTTLSSNEQRKMKEVIGSLKDQIYKIQDDIKSGIPGLEGVLAETGICLIECEGTLS